MLETSVQVQTEISKCYSLAAQQNAYPLIRSISLHYFCDEEAFDNNSSFSSNALSDIKLKLSSSPEIFSDEIWEIGELLQGETLPLQKRPLEIDFNFLDGLTEEVLVSLNFTLINNKGEEYDLCIKQINMLPKNHWGGASRQPDLLAAFVKPNGLFIDSLIHSCAKKLESHRDSYSINGYQSNTREAPYMMAAALWDVLSQQDIKYASPPSGFADEGQRIRLPADISKTKIGACLDISVLFASVLEQMGLNTVIALTKEHAFVGVWLIDEHLPILTNDDPQDIRKRVAARDLVFFESTLITNLNRVSFSQAIEAANDEISEEKEENFVFAVDIAHARARKIRPIPTLEELAKEPGVLSQEEIPLPEPPPLPKVTIDERAIEETEETRIDAWQRKLLDLTKRNPLLSLKDRTVKVNLFCPDIGLMEDMLAAGQTFTFVSSDSYPDKDVERESDVYRMQTGSDLHRDYALSQLDKKILVANQSQKKLDSARISLLRKAKNDLEEGGSNTLFIALGFLKWKENERDTQSHKAPLILIPVKLHRKSAKSKISLKMLVDDEPIFNLTLIEFLKSEYEINLSEFNGQLPEDASGVDVEGVWASVRGKIKDISGFEVVEETVIASFSFAKYLMWKDLRDRVDQLKENPFVKHMVEKPQDAYQQSTEFYDPHDLDKLVCPSEVYAPLNCDSSQMTAVMASAKPQDFVLEGPPGTGKSETIANIICHNLALGRKVLFVAEKMAALNVVYKRLRKVGLGHVCLELHSNKANKKGVLEQLQAAWTKREEAPKSDWEAAAKSLKFKREQLNSYVQELHKLCDYGLTVREVIATAVDTRRVAATLLDWSSDTTLAPISTKKQLEDMLDAVTVISIAFEEIQDLDRNAFNQISQREWSNLWQSDVIDCARQLKSAITNIENEKSSFLQIFKLPELKITTFQDLLALQALVAGFKHSQTFNVPLVLKPKAQKRIDSIRDLKKYHTKVYDKNITSRFGKYELIFEAPVDDWVKKASDANNFLTKFFAKWSINSAIKKHGLIKLKSLDDLTDLNDSKGVLNKINESFSDIDQYKICDKWDVSLERLNYLEETSNQLRKDMMSMVALSDSTETFIPELVALFENRVEYLHDSPQAIQAVERFESVCKIFENTLDDARSKKLDLVVGKKLCDLHNQLDAIYLEPQKLKRWTHWLAQKDVANQFHLIPLINSLENGLVTPKSAKDSVYKGFCKWLSEILIDQSPVLRGFSASQHEQKIQDFVELDKQVASTTSQYINALLASKVPDKDNKHSTQQFGVLAKELQKKQRHIPVRALIKSMGENLLDLTPCLMMSPLSVAQFLPAEFKAFDLVVFDEASQITPWDSVGAIARGANAIIVGDPKQMPPTNFFSAGIKTDDPDEEDLESILDQALAAQLPHLRLTGHYRSRHETLIAFSNSHYYHNSLRTFPAASTKESAVELRRVEGIYAKGKGRNNIKEAQAVVDEIVRRLRDPSLRHLSIGVVTLNTEQQRTIEDLLDEQRRKLSEIEPYFHESTGITPVFVKNLESVQGDERDVIILSLGYGPTEPGAKTMSMNFGPLNKSGGERRLNVAITRATTEVLLFSSFDSGMIDLSRTTSIAVEHLKNYLEFAERGVSALAAIRFAEHGIDQFDSPFEEMVAQQLRDKGWKVQTQVGVSKFRIDLGVIHPTEPGRFIAGVECDGRTYHGSATARDRDRVRQIILEGLGWKIIRIWSTEYFQEPLRVIDQVDLKLRKLLEVESSFDKETTESSQEFTKHAEVADNQLNNEFDDDGDLVPNYSDIESYSVRLGSSVKIRYVSGHMEGEEMTFKVVSEGAELIKTASYREVPINAPVIQALLDKIVGDEASYMTPSGDHKVLVVEVIH